MQSYKETIIDYIEGRTDPGMFCRWLDSNPGVLEWLQELLPADKVIAGKVEVKIDYFLKDLELQKQDEIYTAYHNLCQALDDNNDKQLDFARNLVDLLCALDKNTVVFAYPMDLLLSSYQRILHDPQGCKPSYVQYTITSVREFFERTHDSIQNVPYRVSKLYSSMKTTTKIGTYLNIQRWLHGLITEIYPDEHITWDQTIREKHSLMLDVCPDYIEGYEIDEAGIIEGIIERVPETLPKGRRKKLIKEQIKKEFHIEGAKYPRWVQAGEWPVSPSGKPMRFVEQKRKKGKQYEGMLYTIYVFEDVDTLERRTIEQFT